MKKIILITAMITSLVTTSFAGMSFMGDMIRDMTDAAREMKDSAIDAGKDMKSETVDSAKEIKTDMIDTAKDMKDTTTDSVDEIKSESNVTENNSTKEEEKR
jgi:hypothetical protein